MNVELSVALNQPAQQRDLEVFPGDDFVMALKVFATDSPEDVNPLDLSAATFSLNLGPSGYPDAVVTGVPGAESTFTFTGGYTERRGYKAPYAVVMTLDGKSVTIMFGLISIQYIHGACGYGFCDYGWWWPL